jgi:hypothetical protein
MLETLRFDPSIPFGGYKLSHIQALKEEKKWRASKFWRNFASYYILESASLIPLSLNSPYVQPPSSPYPVKEEPNYS